MSSPPQFADLDKILIRDEENRIVGRIGLFATLYLDTSHEADTKTAIAECAKDYFALFGDRIEYLFSRKRAKRQPNATQLNELLDVLRTASEKEDFSLSLTSAPEEFHESAGAYNFEFVVVGRKPFTDLGYMTFSIPIGELAQQHQSQPAFFQRLFRTWCDRLSPFHGYAGLGVLRSLDTANARAAEPLIYPALAQFPGLEIDNPVSHSVHLAGGIKGVNWLNAISDTFLEKLGGRDAIKAQLSSPEFEIRDYPRGLIIQAGPVPQLGDMSKDHVPASYRKLYKIVRPIQAEPKPVMTNLPEGIDPHQFARLWLRRFE